jgi:hypothetical protein
MFSVVFKGGFLPIHTLVLIHSYLLLHSLKGLLLGAAMYLVLIYTMDGLSSPSPSVSYVAPATTIATESPTEEVQLPHGMTVDETCAALQTRIDNAAQHDNLHQKSVLYYWNKLDCDNKMVLTHSLTHARTYSLTHLLTLNRRIQQQMNGIKCCEIS